MEGCGQKAGVQSAAREYLGFVTVRRHVRRALVRMWDSKSADGIAPAQLRRLAERGLAERAGGSGGWELTCPGRWHAIAAVLGMRPVDLFVASDMYAYYSALRGRGTSGGYSLKPIEAALDSILGPKSVRNMVWAMRSCGMIIRLAPKLYAVTDAGAARLAPYHDDLHDLRAYVRRRLAW